MPGPMTPRDVLLSMLSAAEAMAEGEKISLIAALVDIERDSIVAGRQAWMDAQREGLDRESALRARVAELEADRARAWTHYAECAGTPLMADVMGERDRLRARVAELEEREASVCPEDVGIVECVSTLRAQVDELAMLVRMLVHSVRRTNPDNETARKALDYLQRYNLQGSILRDILRDEADYGAGDCVPTDR